MLCSCSTLKYGRPHRQNPPANAHVLYVKTRIVIQWVIISVGSTCRLYDSTFRIPEVHFHNIESSDFENKMLLSKLNHNTFRIPNVVHSKIIAIKQIQLILSDSENNHIENIYFQNKKKYIKTFTYIIQTSHLQIWIRIQDWHFLHSSMTLSKFIHSTCRIQVWHFHYSSMTHS